MSDLCAQVREGNLATAEGVTYLETKNLLLLQYCMHLVFYLLLKAEGQPVQQHPVIARLVEIRAFLEKIRPIDKKLRYQIDKLLTSHQAVQVCFRPSLGSCLICQGLLFFCSEQQNATLDRGRNQEAFRSNFAKLETLQQALLLRNEAERETHQQALLRNEASDVCIAKPSKADSHVSSTLYTPVKI